MTARIAVLAAVFLAASARAESYGVTLTPEQDAKIAVITEGSGLTVQAYIAKAVAAQIESDYAKAAAPIGTKIVTQWPQMTAGQRAAVCAAAGISPCVPTKDK